MSIIKQKAVSSERHAKNLRNYINDKAALLRDGQHIGIDKNWYREMDSTREIAGHNKPARMGAKNTIMYHQIIAFLPDEADINGGTMTPERCMDYAREYIQTRYPDQQVAFALHLEHCKEDDTNRYAVHMAINRTNLETGKRLDEGRSTVAKRNRADAIRKMDEKWELQQVERDKPNSKIHRQQPRGAEKEITLRGDKSYKSNLRELVRYARDKAASIEEFRSFLDEWGVATEVKNGKVYAKDRDKAKYTFSIPRLDGALNLTGLQETFEQNAYKGSSGSSAAGYNGKQRQATYETDKNEYKQLVVKRYQEYQKQAHGMEGTDFGEFPQLKLPRPSDALRKDPDVQGVILSYLRKADTLRLKLASNTPVAAQGNPQGWSAGQRQGMRQRGSTAPQHQEREDYGKDQQKR